jgi:hypothetical protein
VAAEPFGGVAGASFEPNSSEYRLPWDPASAGIPYDVRGTAGPDATCEGLPFWPNKYE